MTSNKNMRIYVAGPYTASTEEEIQKNVNTAIDAAIAIYKKGHFPYVPHLTHWIEIRSKEITAGLKWEDYLEMDRAWLTNCDAMLFLHSSKGANLELEHAKKINKHVYNSLDEIPLIKRKYHYQF